MDTLKPNANPTWPQLALMLAAASVMGSVVTLLVLWPRISW